MKHSQSSNSMRYIPFQNLHYSNIVIKITQSFNIIFSHLKEIFSKKTKKAAFAAFLKINFRIKL